MRKWIGICVILFLSTGCATSELDARHTNTANRPNPVWPPPPQTPRIRFIRSISSPQDMGREETWLTMALDSIFGKEGTEEQLLRPYDVCVNSGRMYVTDPALSLVHVFDLKTKKYFRIEKAKDELFLSPIGIAVDKEGEIFLSDSVLKKVFAFDRNGKYEREIGSVGLFLRPTGVAVDGERVYVVDTLGNRISVFSKKDGRLLFSVGKEGTGNGEFHYPTHIIVKDGQIYVTDSLNFRVQILDPYGKFISSFGKAGDTAGYFAKLKGIAVDSEGHIYVSDSQFDNVQIFDRNGKLLLVFGGSGSDVGKMSLPSGIFIDEQDQIYLADSYNRRVQIFQYLKDEKRTQRNK